MAALLLMLTVLTTEVWAAPAGYVALSFDDGPSGDNTLALLEMLEAHEVSATFFLCGYRIEAFPALPKQLSEAGHELGVHGYSHTCFNKLTPEALGDELTKTKALITDLTGKTPKLLRPPCGEWDEAVRGCCRDAEMSVILWSVDPEDWRCQDSAEITRRVCGSVKNGDIILMHDLHPSSVEATGKIIETLQKQGYEFVTVSELAALAQCELQPGDVFSQFSGAHSHD